MRILLDNEPCDLTQESVGEAIAAGAAMAKEQGRLIVEIFVDGQQWTSDQLGAEELVAADADEVRLVSARPRELAATVFADASEALDSAESYQNRAAEMIQAGSAAEGLQEFNEALSIWVSVQDAVEQAAGVAEIDLEAAELDGKSGSEVLGELGTQLQQIREQIKAQDLLGVADTLLYDLPAVLRQWRELLE